MAIKFRDLWDASQIADDVDDQDDDKEFYIKEKAKAARYVIVHQPDQIHRSIDGHTDTHKDTHTQKHRHTYTYKQAHAQTHTHTQTHRHIPYMRFPRYV